MTLTDMYKRIDEITSKISWINDDGDIQIYTDYRDRELSNYVLKNIFSSDNPREQFENLVSDWELDVNFTEYDALYDELTSYIKAELSKEELMFWDDYETEVTDYIGKHFSYYYDKNDFNNEINVNIMVDCGNGNYDFTCDNVLNYYGMYDKGKIEDTSSILWLAKTQGKEAKLKEACEAQFRDDGSYVEREKEDDKFIESCIQEFENLSSHMGTLTFLVKIRLFDVFKLLEIQSEEYDEEAKYNPLLNKSESYILLDKSTECGLFDSWHGGGSVLEIELDKDVKLPIKFARVCVDGCKTYGYDVNEVYGLVDSCWKDTIKEIKKVV